jgi:hypothetical protein
MSEGPNPAMVLIGVFMIVAGVCIALVGGGCTIFLIGDMLSYGRSGGLFPFFALSLLGLGLGGFMIWAGIKVMKTS